MYDSFSFKYFSFYITTFCKWSDMYNSYIHWNKYNFIDILSCWYSNTSILFYCRTCNLYSVKMENIVFYSFIFKILFKKKMATKRGIYLLTLKSWMFNFEFCFLLAKKTTTKDFILYNFVHFLLTKAS